jgi:hypothetical protein
MLGLASYFGFLAALGLAAYIGYSRANPYQRRFDPMLARYMVWLRNSYRAPAGTAKSS